MPKKARTLVLCFDGTANQFDGEVRFVAPARPVCLLTSALPQNTNIVKFYALLKKDATEEQLCYYQVRLHR